VTVAASLTSIEWVDPPVLPVGPAPPPHIVQRLKQKYGFVPECSHRLSHCQWVLESYSSPDPQLAFISYELADLIFLVVSQDNSCRHCYGASRAFLRMMGYSERRVLELETDLHSVDLDPTTRIALEYARRLSRSNPRPGPSEEDALLQAGMSREAIAEVALVTAMYVLGNRVATLSALAPSEFESMPDRWYAPFFGPLFRWMVRRDRKRAEPRHFAPGQNTGPASELLAALDGAPGAIGLRETIDRAFASEALPLRAKILVFAVVSRTLGCPAFEHACFDQLIAGGLSKDGVRAALDHLASPELTPLEARLVPIARETVRYQKPAMIQRRMHDLAQHLTPPELLDAIGTFALANALGRLTVLLNRC
jgi:AhpD family alkylhydroperoxidase